MSLNLRVMSFLGVSFLLLCAGLSFAETRTVTRVVDGNTLELTNGTTVSLIGVAAPPIVFPEGEDPTLYDPTGEVLEEARHWGMDFIELSRMGEKTAEFVKGYVRPGQEVLLKYDAQTKDDYDRGLVYLYIPMVSEEGQQYMGVSNDYQVIFKRDGVNWVYIFLNATIIKHGYAKAVSVAPNVRHKDLFERLYQRARDNKSGLWTAAPSSSLNTLLDLNEPSSAGQKKKGGLMDYLDGGLINIKASF